MTSGVSKAWLVAAVVANAMIVGASWDQAVKQLPARHVIGAEAFSDYSQAADLRTGIAWYATLGITAAVLAVAVAVHGLVARPRVAGAQRVLFVVALAATVGHTVVTAFAAPLNFSQRDTHGDPAALAEVFDQFAQLNLLRAIVQTIALAVLAATLILTTRPTGAVRT